MIPASDGDGELIERRVEDSALIDDLRYNPATGLYYVSHDPDGLRELSTTVVGAIAAASGTDVDEIAPLSGTFDLDALNALFRGTGSEQDGVARLTFVHEGRRVTIYASGDVVIRP